MIRPKRAGKWIREHKLAITLVLACVIFVVATVTLCVEQEKLKGQLDSSSGGDPTTMETPTDCSIGRKGRQCDTTMKTTTTTATTTATATAETTVPTSGTSGQADDTDEWRLPGNCFPLEYDLTLEPNLEDGTYSGRIEILFYATERLSLIKLNSKGLEFSTEDVTVSNIHPNSLVFRTEQGVVYLEMYRELQIGQQKMTIRFRGGMTDRIVGFYRSVYQNRNGTDRYIATSKLEPTYARQAFPCFDEPQFKAKYTVHIVIPDDEEYIALSNMNQVGEPLSLNGTNTSLVSFAQSVPMSTYLVCFIVCDFNFTQTTVRASVGDNVTLRVYATPAQQDKTAFALSVAKDVTAYYIDYFGIEYPLPKLDMIAIPDFVSGAMEHWGLVTFRETALLYDAKTSSSFNQQRVATVVAHELAHMWFGNLVTMKWWNDLWLNEGFATYMQYKAADRALPDWGLMDQFAALELHPVLGFDSSLASHPIVQKVVTPDQITEMFDSISYAKGACVLRMLENAVGEEVFQRAIRNYLTRFKYSSAVTRNLLDEIQAIERSFDVIDFMDTWTTQMGYPIVSVARDGDTYTLTQKRFLSNPENVRPATPSPPNYEWTIPITYVTDQNVSGMHWFEKLSSDLTVTIPNARWVKFNSKQVGYYRVDYPQDVWLTLSRDMKAQSVLDRIHLLDDSFSIAKVGTLTYDVPLTMTKFLKEESSYVVWRVAAAKFYQLKRLLLNTPTEDKLKAYVRSLVVPIQKKLTWNENPKDNHAQKLARATVTKLACAMGHPETLAEAAKLFRKWLLNGHDLAQNTKSIVYDFGMANATSWNTLFDIYRAQTDAQEKIKLMSGLASIREPTLLKRLIQTAEDETIVRRQDYFNCLESIAANPSGTSLVWDHVRENWTDIVARFTLNDRYLGRMVKSITSTFSTQVRLNEMEDFFQRYPEAGAGATARKQALETVANNIKWLDKHQKQVDEWLDKNVDR